MVFALRWDAGEVDSTSTTTGKEREARDAEVGRKRGPVGRSKRPPLTCRSGEFPGIKHAPSKADDRTGHYQGRASAGPEEVPPWYEKTPPSRSGIA